jgi:hypothetical protein
MKDLGMITRIGGPVADMPTGGLFGAQRIPFRTEVLVEGESAILRLTFNAAKVLKKELDTYLKNRGEA